MLLKAMKSFKEEPGVDQGNILALTEITLNDLTRGGEIDEEDFGFQMDVNLYGLYGVTRAFAPMIMESKGRERREGLGGGGETGLVTHPTPTHPGFWTHCVRFWAFAGFWSCDLSTVPTKNSDVKSFQQKKNLTRNKFW